MKVVLWTFSLGPSLVGRVGCIWVCVVVEVWTVVLVQAADTAIVFQPPTRPAQSQCIDMFSPSDCCEDNVW